jgi:hypothetical protein
MNAIAMKVKKMNYLSGYFRKLYQENGRHWDYYIHEKETSEPGNRIERLEDEVIVIKEKLETTRKVVGLVILIIFFLNFILFFFNAYFVNKNKRKQRIKKIIG